MQTHFPRFGLVAVVVVVFLVTEATPLLSFGEESFRLQVSEPLLRALTTEPQGR